MANHKSAEKRHRQSIRRRDRNRAARSAVRSAVKTAVAGIESRRTGKAEITEVKTLVVQAESMLASAAKKGIVHPRTARRKISRLAKKAVLKA